MQALCEGFVHDVYCVRKRGKVQVDVNLFPPRVSLHTFLEAALGVRIFLLMARKIVPLRLQEQKVCRGILWRYCIHTSCNCMVPLRMRTTP